MNFLEKIIFDSILSNLGGLLRYLFGTIYRTIFKMKTYTFRECMDGPPEEGLNYISKNNRHKKSNEFIGIIFILLIALIISFIV